MCTVVCTCIWCVYLKSCLSITKLFGKWDEKSTSLNKQKFSFNSIKTQRFWIELPTGFKLSSTSNWNGHSCLLLSIRIKTIGVDICVHVFKLHLWFNLIFILSSDKPVGLASCWIQFQSVLDVGQLFANQILFIHKFNVASHIIICICTGLLVIIIEKFVKNTF